jgi:hypothetical protein
MYDPSGELTVIPIIVWLSQKVGKDCRLEKKQHRRLMWRCLISRSSEMEVRKQFQIEISNRFEALENLNDSEDISRAWKNIK